MALQILPLPTLPQTLAIIATAFIFTPLCLLLYNLTLHPLATYPGPLLHRSSRLPWVLALQRGRLHNVLHALHTQYGPVVRVAPNELSYTSPAAWKDIYLNPRIQRADLWFRKQDVREPWSLLSADEESHGRFKRAFMGGFGERALREHAGTMEGYVCLMMEKLRELCGEGGGEAVVDIVDWLNMVTFDVSGDLSFGSSFGSTETGKPHPWVEISNQFGKGVALMASLNYYHSGLTRLLKGLMPKRVMEKMAWHKELVRERVGERIALEGRRRDFVQSVLDWNAEGKGKEVTKEEIELNMSVVIFAGSETTATALASTLWYLLRSESWLRRVVGEVRGAFDREEEILLATTNKLEVLTAVISEGMRLGPPSVVAVPRIVGKGGEVVCGRRVPGGTVLGMSQYPTFRSSLNFKNPETFDPSRFMTGSNEAESAAFYPFLIGRHSCLGEKFAWAEMRVLLARLSFSFDLSLADPGHLIMRDWGEQKTFVFWQKERLEVRLKPVA